MNSKNIEPKIKLKHDSTYRYGTHAISLMFSHFYPAMATNWLNFLFFRYFSFLSWNPHLKIAQSRWYYHSQCSVESYIVTALHIICISGHYQQVCHFEKGYCKRIVMKDEWDCAVLCCEKRRFLVDNSSVWIVILF